MDMCNKIVRDNIPDILKKLGKNLNFETLKEDEKIEYLYLNLTSSIYDSFNSKSLDSIVDSIELLISIAQEYGYTEEDVIVRKNNLNDEKGRYSKNFILKSNY